VFGQKDIHGFPELEPVLFVPEISVAFILFVNVPHIPIASSQGVDHPIGYHFMFGNSPSVELDIEIVGVVSDSKYENLRDAVPRPSGSGRLPSAHLHRFAAVPWEE